MGGELGVPGGVGDDPWLPISDLMAGLMVVFMFVSILYISKIRNVTDGVQKKQDWLCRELQERFKGNMKDWGMEVDCKRLTVTFYNPKILFERGSAQLKPAFGNILNTFVPTFFEMLNRENPATWIREVRIEGHTSSEWKGRPSSESPYFLNMKLSQDRARKVMQYIYSLPCRGKHEEFLKIYLTANGYSSSRMIRHENHVEDKDKSRRVVFRVVSKLYERMAHAIDPGVLEGTQVQ